MINALSFDLEFWYSPELVRKYVTSEKRKTDQITEAVGPILDILDKHNTKATFFVLGMVAEKYPHIVKMIFEKNHEIASHGYSHLTLHELGRDTFEKEIVKSIILLESVTGERPIGFRAPTFSINNSTKWGLEILKSYGFRYDSSIFPIKTTLYGVPNAPVHIYKVSTQDVSKEDPNGSIVEFPMTVTSCGMNIPISGGFYFRLLPTSILKTAIKRVNRERPAMIYLHPWECYTQTPRLSTLPFSSRVITYWGINSTLKKLNVLLNEFNFKPVRYVLDNYS